MNSKQKEISVKLLLLCITLLSSILAYTQNGIIDSLKKSLQTQQNDTGKVNTLNALSFQFRYTNTDTSMYFSNTALILATKLKFEKGMADSKVRIGMGYATLGKYNEGAKSSEEAVDIYKKLLLSTTVANKENLLKKLGSAYNVIAHNRIAQGNIAEGLKSSFLALEIREKIGSKSGIADTEFNIGIIYSQQHNYAEALKHYYIALKIYEALGNKAFLSSTYTSIGEIFFERGKVPLIFF